MTTRNAQFFSRPYEFAEILAETIGSLRLNVCIWISQKEPIFAILDPPFSYEAVQKFGITQIFLSAEKPRIASSSIKNIHPARLGWIQVDLPVEREGTLFLTQMGLKADWYDSKGQRHVNQDLLVLWSKFTKPFKKKIMHPVWGYNVTIMKKAVSYRDLGFMDSVRDFVDQGGELRQRGVENTRFTLEKPHFS